MQDNPDRKKQEQEQILELGSDITKSSKGNIYTLTIIGQIEGHQVLPENVKTTKYEHMIPQLVAVDESPEIEGLLILLNTIGGELAQTCGVPYLFSDFKKREGYKRSIQLSSEYKLYRQDYCGCAFSKAEAQRRKNPQK